MTSIWLPLEIGAGHITKTLQDAQRIATQLNCGVTFSFNGVQLYITPDSDLKKVRKEYSEQVTSDEQSTPAS